MTATAVPSFPALDVTQVQPDDQRLWSVTTIIGALDKPALLYWSAEMAAELAIDEARNGNLAKRYDLDPEAAVKFYRDARFHKRPGVRTAAELGTAIHAACEAYALTGERPAVDDEVLPYIVQFEKWCQLWQPSYEAAELTVFSPTYGYAGTLDAIASLNGTRVILDYKSSRKSVDYQGKPSTPYPEVSLQLSALRWAELAAVWRPRRHEYFRRRYYLLNAEERQQAVAVPEVQGGICVHITPEHCHAYVVRCDRDVHDSFLYVLEAARWQFELSKSVVGERLVHSKEGR